MLRRSLSRVLLALLVGATSLLATASHLAEAGRPRSSVKRVSLRFPNADPYDLSTEAQESITTQNISGTDTALSDTLDQTPVYNAAVKLYLNGVLQRQGATYDYTLSGKTITWLASSGTADDMTTSDVLIAVYRY